MQSLWSILVAAGILAGAAGASAQQAASERYQLDGIDVTVVAHEFLTEEEVLTLRLVGQNRDALSLFLPEGEDYLALAVAPAEGFMRAGEPVASATAISGLADMDSTRASALELCNDARNGGSECQIVLEIAPR